jgi:RNA-directed DNA polymerase
VAKARERCWRYDWVLDLDIKGFFDSIDWELMLKAVRRHTDCLWVLLYIERWLRSPVQMEDGRIVARMAGTPQGGVISPLLANLFLHYAFDMWMAREFPHIPFERYADDGVPRTHRRKEVRNCVRDGGRPSGAGRQGQASNHRKLRRSKAGVVSVAEKAGLDLVRYGSERRA